MTQRAPEFQMDTDSLSLSPGERARVRASVIIEALTHLTCLSWRTKKCCASATRQTRAKNTTDIAAPKPT
jgi:hypothetical protein